MTLMSLNYSWWPSGTVNGGRGYLPSSQQGGGGGTYLPADWGGVTHLRYPPSQPRVGTPAAKVGTLPPPGNRATQRVLATRQAVCLLRSRKRTFLCEFFFFFFSDVNVGEIDMSDNIKVAIRVRPLIQR